MPSYFVSPILTGLYRSFELQCMEYHFIELIKSVIPNVLYWYDGFRRTLVHGTSFYWIHSVIPDVLWWYDVFMITLVDDISLNWIQKECYSKCTLLIWCIYDNSSTSDVFSEFHQDALIVFHIFFINIKVSKCNTSNIKSIVAKKLFILSYFAFIITFIWFFSFFFWHFLNWYILNV